MATDKIPNSELIEQLEAAFAQLKEILTSNAAFCQLAAIQLFSFHDNDGELPKITLDGIYSNTKIKIIVQISSEQRGGYLYSKDKNAFASIKISDDSGTDILDTTFSYTIGAQINSMHLLGNRPGNRFRHNTHESLNVLVEAISILSQSFSNIPH